LKALKISGASNAKVVTKRNIVATKMVQRLFSVEMALSVVDNCEGRLLPIPTTAQHLISIPPTVLKTKKSTQGIENIIWQRGDVPVFENGEVVPGLPTLQNERNEAPTTTREPEFTGGEYCRLLHVLADSRMTTARAQLMEPRTRPELDGEPIDPWTDNIAPLFNDTTFQPRAVSVLAGGVTRADIISLDPSVRAYERDGGVLKRKFGSFKSVYGTCLSKYEASGQGDPEGFVYFTNGKSYLMYAYCFLQTHSILQPLATRALQTDAQREEGVGSGVTPELSSSGKRKRERQ